MCSAPEKLAADVLVVLVVVLDQADELAGNEEVDLVARQVRSDVDDGNDLDADIGLLVGRGPEDVAVEGRRGQDLGRNIEIADAHMFRSYLEPVPA